jgi:hypothetical protein
MIFTLKDAAEHWRSSRAPKAFPAFIAQVKRILTFTQERANRLRRFGEVTSAYRDGVPVADIESKYGCSKNTVLRYARLAEIEKRPKCFDPRIRKAVILLYKSGNPIAQISAQLGVSQAYVSKTATEEGLNRRNFAKARRSA